MFSAPVWLAARVVGAEHPTLLRAVASLATGMLGSFLLAMLTGPWAFFLAPLAFLFSFKYALGTSLLGSVLLAIVAGIAYAAMGYFFGGTFSGVGSGMIV